MEAAAPPPPSGQARRQQQRRPRRPQRPSPVARGLGGCCDEGCGGDSGAPPPGVLGQRQLSRCGGGRGAPPPVSLGGVGCGGGGVGSAVPPLSPLAGGEVVVAAEAGPAEAAGPLSYRLWRRRQWWQLRSQRRRRLRLPHLCDGVAAAVAAAACGGGGCTGQPLAPTRRMCPAPGWWCRRRRRRCPSSRSGHLTPHRQRAASLAYVAIADGELCLWRAAGTAAVSIVHGWPVYFHAKCSTAKPSLFSTDEFADG